MKMGYSYSPLTQMWKSHDHFPRETHGVFHIDVSLPQARSYGSSFIARPSFDHLLASQSSEDQIFGRGRACVPNFPEVALICSREEEAAMKARGLAICHIADGNCLFRAQPKRLELLAHWRSRTARLEHHPIWRRLSIAYAFVRPTSHQTQKIRSKH